ncbi:hypothetical protein O0L34_g10763 [Tuta absoluta]|nr:hypothetical protein O0L34_g10763 [Tuta absoluta]
MALENIGAPRSEKVFSFSSFMPGSKELKDAMRLLASSLQEKNSHFEELTWSPIFVNPATSVFTSSVTDSQVPPIVPSSRYHTLSLDFSEVTTLWIAKLKMRGPKGSPC